MVGGHQGGTSVINHNIATSADANTARTELLTNTSTASREWLTMNDFRHQI